MNILILVYLKPASKAEISPKNIDIGFFSANEIEQIQKRNFIKSNNFNLRLIAKLSEIIYSNKKAYRSCSSGKQCKRNYFRKLTIEIACNSDSLNFYFDCLNATSLNIELQYLDNSGYPSYNCGFKTNNNTCSSVCPSLTSTYQVYLIQQINDYVELAWKDLANCEIIQPNIKLTQETDIDLCDGSISSGNIKFTEPKLLAVFLIFSFLIFF